MPQKIIVAIHGIGDQFRYETIQAVANQVCGYFGKPPAIPLGRFHSQLYTEAGTLDPQRLEDSLRQIQAQLAQLVAGAAGAPPGAPAAAAAANPAVAAVAPPAALVLSYPPDPALPADLAFTEVYWADVPRKPAKDEHTLEESKKWARTLVERIRLYYEHHFDNVKIEDCNYEVAATVIEEMIETVAVLDQLLFLAKKAGIFEFDLKKVLVDYLGDVQIVTEFKFYREKILAVFDTVMTAVHAADPAAEIYLIAHSEGTVVSFLGLLRALSATQPPAWVRQVRGFMTIGSPINKHLILWPELWKDLVPQSGALPPNQKIQWRNYYDYGDPIGFELETTRQWLKDRCWTRVFEFPDDDDHDVGFARYPFPGEAHNEYWNDPVVFGHFIQNVVRPLDRQTGALIGGPTEGQRPTSNPYWYVISPLLPYALAALLCYLAVYLLYKGVVEFLEFKRSTLQLLGNVAGLAGLLMGLTVAARIPRLTLLWRWWLVGWGFFVITAALYPVLVVPETRVALGSWLSHVASWVSGAFGAAPWPWLWEDIGVLGVAGGLALLAPRISSRSAYWGGTRMLLILGGAAISLMVVHLILESPNQKTGPMWPLLLASAAFLYLWWLSALIFDLAFVWHRYIRWSVVETRLRQLKPKPANQDR